MKKKIITIFIVLVVLLGAAAFLFRDAIGDWFEHTFVVCRNYDQIIDNVP